MYLFYYFISVHGNWGEWSDYGACEAEDIALCGEEGIKTRSRNCDSPAPADGGLPCKTEDDSYSMTEQKGTTCTGYCAPGK